MGIRNAGNVGCKSNWYFLPMCVLYFSCLVVSYRLSVNCLNISA